MSAGAGTGALEQLQNVDWIGEVFVFGEGGAGAGAGVISL